MRWRKLGLVYRPSSDLRWASQYAHLPTPVVLDGKTIRVYFAGLDAQKFGRIGFVDVDAERPTRVLRVSEEPSLDLGEPGLFDDSGVNPSCVLRVGDRWRMYYIGWQRTHRVPYTLFAGLAESLDGTRFERMSRTPVLERSDAEPVLRSATSVLADEGGFRTWYVSATGWTTVRGQPYPRYLVRTVASANGLTWPATGSVCIDLTGDEFGIGRPWVIRDPDCHCMWYSIRAHSRPYRIGYAESADGLHWERRDCDAGIETSASGWDSGMVCYAAVIDVNGRRLMFYNGNRHGATGFG
ncbi:MAG TPA: hypothetical protein VKD71_03600, partial [Gemmataceae bacterium]|nr:hypothetical protein [Gemmataceae bacterium]